MNKIQKIIFFISLSCIFSLKVTNIEPNTATLGEDVTFTLTVQDYDSSNYYDFTIGDDFNKIYMSCNRNDASVSCNARIQLNKNSLNDLKKTLYVNGVSTGLTVTINKPTTLKLLDFYPTNVYSYGVTNFEFDVNDNDLYNSNVKIQIGDITLSKCEKDQNYNEINCEYAFPESYGGKTLELTFNGQKTGLYISIQTPKAFTTIEDNERDEYYSSSSSQYVYFYVDSSYKMNDNNIVLVPESSGNANITLTGCTYDDYGIYYAKCSAVLNKNDGYYVYVNSKKTDVKVMVYSTPTV